MTSKFPSDPGLSTFMPTGNTVDENITATIKHLKREICEKQVGQGFCEKPKTKVPGNNATMFLLRGNHSVFCKQEIFTDVCTARYENIGKEYPGGERLLGDKQLLSRILKGE